MAKGGKQKHKKNSGNGKNKNTLRIEDSPNELNYGIIVKALGSKRFEVKPINGESNCISYQITNKAGYIKRGETPCILYSQDVSIDKNSNKSKCVILKVIPNEEFNYLKKNDSLLKAYFNREDDDEYNHFIDSSDESDNGINLKDI